MSAIMLPPAGGGVTLPGCHPGEKWSLLTQISIQVRGQLLFVMRGPPSAASASHMVFCCYSVLGMDHFKGGISTKNFLYRMYGV